MTAPTRLRGRSPRNISVEIFHLFSLLPLAWEQGSLEWHTKETNQGREAPLIDVESVLAFARGKLAAFQIFLLDHEHAFVDHDPWVVTSARGEAPFSVLIDSQRTHAAVHHRQLVDFLSERGATLRGVLDVDAIADLDLPQALY